MIYPVYVKVPLVTGVVVSLISISITSGISQTVEKQILGTWQTEVKGQKILFVFTSENKLFVVSPTKFEDPEQKSPPLTAIEFKYQINSQTQPIQLDFFDGSNPKDKALTILEIAQDNSLKIQLEGVQPNQPRPTDFVPNATIFARVSNSTILPANVVRVDKLQEYIARENQNSAKINVLYEIRAVNRNQTAYRAEKSRFANTFDALALEILRGKSRYQTTDYSYQLFGRKNRAYITAAAKTKGLQSYVGATFFYLNSAKQSVISSIICETEKPTKTPPKFPKFVGGNNPIKCPIGSKQVD
ncbi:type IV pilin-like G/H family protein [Merismopedia glauca]|uniref:Uncharacterized protein n=1 Tax=Merismopedia glauca CCAP 1448/3 TaxID=1296344 RepID=A0A2T1CAH0_9CYAN|nr:type IV pilin-like G/H family protein [Merismopedia glauca]PSB05229.1 hypothetical protein C7B64_00015 [Merismopedia glauca CCAP 1448/3]